MALFHLHSGPESSEMSEISSHCALSDVTKGTGGKAAHPARLWFLTLLKTGQVLLVLDWFSGGGVYLWSPA